MLTSSKYVPNRYFFLFLYWMEWCLCIGGKKPRTSNTIKWNAIQKKIALLFAIIFNWKQTEPFICSLLCISLHIHMHSYMNLTERMHLKNALCCKGIQNDINSNMSAHSTNVKANGSHFKCRTYKNQRSGICLFGSTCSVYLNQKHVLFVGVWFNLTRLGNFNPMELLHTG